MRFKRVTASTILRGIIPYLPEHNGNKIEQQILPRLSKRHFGSTDFDMSSYADPSMGLVKVAQDI